MISYNKVLFIGNTGKDPIVNKTTEDIPYARFSIAVDKYTGRDKNGKSTNEPIWINVVAWRKLAEQVEKIVRKGALVLVEGKLEIRNYTDKNNVERTGIEVIASAIQNLEKKAPQHTDEE